MAAGRDHRDNAARFTLFGRAALAAIAARREATQARLTRLRIELDVAWQSAYVAEERLGSRIRQLYQSGRVDPVSVLLGAESLDEAVSGLEGLKTWLLERRKLFQMRDSLSAEIVPKGVLLMGIPGCGKSLSVKAIASCFQLPLYRVDMIEIFSGRHGKPEGAFVAACKMMEDMAPAVLWFDEIEMGVTSAESGGEQGRIFAFFPGRRLDNLQPASAACANATLSHRKGEKNRRLTPPRAAVRRA